MKDSILVATKQKSTLSKVLSSALPLLIAGAVWTTPPNLFQKNELNALFVSRNHSSNSVDSSLIKRNLDTSIRKDEWPETITWENNPLRVEYTINRDLNDYVKKTLAKYKSDYSTVVVIDNQTGNIIAAAGYEGKSQRFNNELAFSNTHPSASIFKIITSAELLKNNKVDVDTRFTFTGRSTTLYKNQLRETASVRWARPQTFRKAFAVSNNVIFAKAAMRNISPNSIYKTANDFGFNQQLMEEITLPQSYVSIPEDPYEMAQLASGFNDETTMSPVHGALLSSVIANDGVMKFPNLVTRLVNNRGETIWTKQMKDRRVLDKETSEKMRELMSSTIDEGTARKGFRKMRTLYRQELEIGGKTGHITGGTPFGKRDWFTAFAMPKTPEFGKGISICVMNVNIKRWHVRSSAVAKEVIEYYYGKVLPIGQNVTKVSKKKYARRDV